MIVDEKFILFGLQVSLNFTKTGLRISFLCGLEYKSRRLQFKDQKFRRFNPHMIVSGKSFPH